MFIQIDFASQTPIYEQVAQQIKFAVAAGSLPVDELIPSVRELSKQLALNPNTVARAYRSLQDEAVESVRRWKETAKPKLDPETVLRMELEENELKRLRNENKRLKMENDILKKATAYFARETM